MANWYRHMLAALVLGITLTQTGYSAPLLQATTRVNQRTWTCYGSYHCYRNACNAAAYLRRCGYSTCICYSNSCYHVYYC